MELLAAGPEQGPVGCILDQGVLEAVDRLGRDTAAEHQLGGDQLVEGGLKLRLRPVGDRGEQRVKTRGRSRRRSGLLLDRREAIEAGEQGIVECAGMASGGRGPESS